MVKFKKGDNITNSYGDGILVSISKNGMYGVIIRNDGGGHCGDDSQYWFDMEKERDKNCYNYYYVDLAYCELLSNNELEIEIW